jgi:hypothetical protein
MGRAGLEKFNLGRGQDAETSEMNLRHDARIKRVLDRLRQRHRPAVG